MAENDQDELDAAGAAAGHGTDVEERGDGSWDAVCRCGWESTGHEDRDAAESATDEHRHNPGD